MGNPLERGLKWLALLSQLLLRAPRRGGDPGRGNVAKRFDCLARRQDWGALLVLWEKDRRLLKEEQEREGGRETREEEGEEARAERLKRQVMKHLGAGQISKAVGLISSHGVAPLEDPLVWAQVESKYPDRKQVIPTNIPK